MNLPPLRWPHRWADAREAEAHAYETGHTHRQPRAVLVAIIAAVALVLLLQLVEGAYLFTVNARNADTERRLDALELYVAERRQINEDRDARDQEATRLLLCDALDVFPADDPDLEQLRARLRCTPTPTTGAP